MKKVYGYIRVSTAKQGEGVSLVAQKEAIMRYASQYNLTIVEWFEERETAAKQGRPLFTKMMNLLKQNRTTGIIMHKIDRSARNLRDWVDLGALIDQGVEVHFAHESLDLRARGGRLSADIQAVIAADYIRNLREETIKGLYGRLNQGIYPFAAPTGYLNTGKGKLKTIDPIQGPLVRKAFELYATGKYSLERLAEHMRGLGLKNSVGKPISKSRLSELLNNTFYMGVIKVKDANFNGLHEPLVSPEQFDEVRKVLRGRLQQKIRKHSFKFRRLLRCQFCGYSLIGELQKGKVYYRCHSKKCPTKGVTESHVESLLINTFKSCELHLDEVKVITDIAREEKDNFKDTAQETIKILNLQITNAKDRIDRLIDYYVDGGLTKEVFEERKEKLLFEIKSKEASISKLSVSSGDGVEKTIQFLELTKSLVTSYIMGNEEEKRNLVQIVTSNLYVEGKKLWVAMRIPFSEVQNSSPVLLGCHPRDIYRKMHNGISIRNNEQFFLAPVDPPVRKPMTKKKLLTLKEFLFEYFN